MHGWTSQRVMELAPDAASGKAGQGLASPRKWPSTGRDAGAVWGECQGSGSKPYQVQVDLSGPTFKCSCPSRKFPCKHGIGLMLMAAADGVPEAPQPQWVTDWLASRVERAEKKQAKIDAPPKPVDEAAQSRRREKRLGQVADGLASLDVWVRDLVRGGLATVPGRGYAFFDDPARRMVDAQAPGVAARLRGLAAVASGGAGWERRFAEELASLHLLVAAHARLDDLPEPTRDDVLATLGIAQPTEAVLARPAVRDRWQIIAREVIEDDRLRTARTWLFGTATRRPAVVITSAYGGAAIDVSLSPGTAFDGDLCFYPGTGPRAAVKARGTPSRLAALDGPDTVDGLCDLASAANAAHPWLGEIVVPVRSLTAVRSTAGLALVDRAGQSVPAVLADAAQWTLLAISGGSPTDLAVAFDGRRARPLGMVHDGAFTSLVAEGDA